jgi:hypothetical protein
MPAESRMTILSFAAITAREDFINSPGQFQKKCSTAADPLVKLALT